MICVCRVGGECVCEWVCICECASRSYLKTTHRDQCYITHISTSPWNASHADATAQERHANEWESLVKYTEWQIALRTPLTAQFRAEWGIICIQMVCLYESMMDEDTNIDSVTVSTFFISNWRTQSQGSHMKEILKEMADWYKYFSEAEIISFVVHFQPGLVKFVAFHYRQIPLEVKKRSFHLQMTVLCCSKSSFWDILPFGRSFYQKWLRSEAEPSSFRGEWLTKVMV